MPLEINASLPLTVLQTERFKLLDPNKQFKRISAMLIRFCELTLYVIVLPIAFCRPHTGAYFHCSPVVGTLACSNNRFCARTDKEPCTLFQNRKPLAKTNICPHLWRRILCLPLLRPIKRVHCDIRTNIIHISNLSWRIPTRLVGFTLENSYKSPENAIRERIKPSQEAKNLSIHTELSRPKLRNQRLLATQTA